jgi:hypothetical protein
MGVVRGLHFGQYRIVQTEAISRYEREAERAKNNKLSRPTINNV